MGPALLLCSVLPSAAVAGTDSLSTTASLHTQSTLARNPPNHVLYATDSDMMTNVIGREAVTWRPARQVAVEANAYCLITGVADKTSPLQILINSQDATNRNALLENHWMSGDMVDGQWAIDRLNVQANIGATKIAAGRMAINMSVMALFTPNDIFAPFRPYNYYREYKPGVDAIRLDRGIGAKSQLSLIGVAGYTPAPANTDPTPQNHRYSPQLSSGLLRGNTTVGGFELAAFGGQHGLYDIYGGSLQGGWRQVGLKAEAARRSLRQGVYRASELVLGLDWRPTATLLLQIEQFYHGSGYARAADYVKLENDPQRPTQYVGRQYSGFGALYDISPLVKAKTLATYNIGDKSAILAANVTYSVAENAEFAATMLVPGGRGSATKEVQSEFGTYPRVLTIESSIYW